MPVPSPYWGDKLYWFDQVIPNHAAMDSKGRVWMSARFRVPENQPAFCKDHPSAALAPAAEQLPADPVLRSEDPPVHAGRHLLRHASRAVRVGSGRNAVRKRPVQRRDRLGEDARAGRDRRCRGGTGLVPSMLRRQSGRQDRSSVDRPIPIGLLVQRHSAPRRQRLGRIAGSDAGKDHPHRPEDLRRAKPTSRRSIPRRAWSAIRRAGSTSTQTA